MPKVNVECEACIVTIVPTSTQLLNFQYAYHATACTVLIIHQALNMTANYESKKGHIP